MEWASLIASQAAIGRIENLNDSRNIVIRVYPIAKKADIVVAIVQAARILRDLNLKYLNEGNGTSVTARFGEDGKTIVILIAAEGI